jgi:hypothetical protein
MSTNDEQWTRWCADFDAAKEDIQRLFHNRYVWLTVNEMIQQTGQSIGFNTIVQNWITTLYATSQCTGIRREADSDSRTTSLERCLRRLCETPTMADRVRYEAGILANPDTPDRYRRRLMSGFDDFAASPGALDLDVVRIAADIADLRAAVETTRKYTNKIVAHRETLDVAISLPWADLDQALNAVGRVLKRYYRLRHPGSILGNLTPELPLGWETPFRSAWCPQDYWPSPVRPKDDYVRSANPA